MDVFPEKKCSAISINAIVIYSTKFCFRTCFGMEPLLQKKWKVLYCIRLCFYTHRLYASWNWCGCMSVYDCFSCVKWRQNERKKKPRMWRWFLLPEQPSRWANMSRRLLTHFSLPPKRKKTKREKIQLHYLTQKTTVYANDSEDESGESLCVYYILCRSKQAGRISSSAYSFPLG